MQLVFRRRIVTVSQSICDCSGSLRLTLPGTTFRTYFGVQPRSAILEFRSSGRHVGADPRPLRHARGTSHTHDHTYNF